MSSYCTSTAESNFSLSFARALCDWYDFRIMQDVLLEAKILACDQARL